MYWCTIELCHNTVVTLSPFPSPSPPPPSLPPVFPLLKERLGDAKEQVREQGQQLIQQIFQNVVSSPQTFLDKLMDVCLVHKNWRVKEQGLLCLSRTLS